LRRVLRIDSRVADPRQNLDREQNEAGEDDEERQDVHLRQPRSPRRDRHPQTADDDDELDGEIAEEAGSARVLVWPEGECNAERADKDEACASADHGRALLDAFLGAPLLLALHLLEGRRWLWRESLELALDLF